MENIGRILVIQYSKPFHTRVIVRVHVLLINTVMLYCMNNTNGVAFPGSTQLSARSTNLINYRYRDGAMEPPTTLNLALLYGL